MTDTLVLTRRDVIDVLPMDACIDAVQQAFTLLARGLCDPPQVLGAHVAHGGFHVKTAGLSDGRHVYVAKVNANFPGNLERHGCPPSREFWCSLMAIRASRCA